MKKREIIINAINILSEPIIIERDWEMLERFIWEMWENLWEEARKNITIQDLHFAFVDANIMYKMMNNDFDIDVYYNKWKWKSI